ncbi:hypothetical protein J5226_01500 [Lysobacter sp. K5869]|uniref:hypothetical protein n=1 Tax=Lysobacter sp. K5869 TaxID=2820808 RepID=UPI001C064992|nr:hypothetical protein [Lysobacter sp. K5869]QWP77109.1 hypothetical protein J5226_01500 [Lysobacter sp. K5869]
MATSARVDSSAADREHRTAAAGGERLRIADARPWRVEPKARARRWFCRAARRTDLRGRNAGLCCGARYRIRPAPSMPTLGSTPGASPGPSKKKLVMTMSFRAAALALALVSFAALSGEAGSQPAAPATTQWICFYASDQHPEIGEIGFLVEGGRRCPFVRNDPTYGPMIFVRREPWN